MAKTAIAFMRVRATPKDGRVEVVVFPDSVMVKDIRQVSEATDLDMPGSRSVLKMRDDRLIYTAHAMVDFVNAINGDVNLTITPRKVEDRVRD